MLVIGIHVLGLVVGFLISGGLGVTGLLSLRFPAPCSYTCPVSHGELKVNVWNYMGIRVTQKGLNDTYSTTRYLSKSCLKGRLAS